MAEVLLFHHALGLTKGVLSFADELHAAGHVVHVPDLFDGKTFHDVADGVAYAEEIGFDTIIERARDIAHRHPNEIVYAGFSLGVLPAQFLAQTFAGARGALLFHACVPPSEFGVWPDGLPAQIHIMEDDEICKSGGDLDAAKALAAENDTVDLFLYPGDSHLFADNSLIDYDQDAATLLKERVRSFLENVPT